MNFTEDIDFEAIFKRIPLLSNQHPSDFKIDKLSGFTNVNFRLRVDQIDWVLRVPKTSTNRFIDRDFERSNLKSIEHLGLMPEILWSDSNGLSLSATCNKARSLKRLDLREPAILQVLMSHISRLHSSNLHFSGQADLAQLLTQYFNLLPESVAPLLRDYFRSAQSRLASIARSDQKIVPSHNDLVLENLLVEADNRIWIIDWEYSAMASPYWDLATLCNTARFDSGLSEYMLESYRTQAFDLNIEHLREYQFLLQLLTTCWMATFSIEGLASELDWLIELDTD